MKRKLIIRIESDTISDEAALGIIALVVAKGRVSETAGRKHYCHVSCTNTGTEIHAMKNTDFCDSFVIR